MQPPNLDPTVPPLADLLTASLTSSILGLTMSTPSAPALDALDLVSSITASTLLAVFTAAAQSSNLTNSMGPPPPPPPPPEHGECKLLGPFAVFIQAALGALALLSLVFKRWRERPQRPVKIWAFDVSKQVVGSILLHLANLLMSMFSAGELRAAIAPPGDGATAAAISRYQPNPCSFYLLNLAIDTTLGIPVLIIILKVLTVGFSYTPLANPPESIMSGHYGSPPKSKWWLKQSLIYFVGLVGMKICVFIFFQLCPWIVKVGDWALRWTEGNEALQIAFVMLIFPLIMNAIQYYIIDTFIKQKHNDDTDQEEDIDDDITRRGSIDEHGALLSDGSEDEDGSSKPGKSKAKDSSTKSKINHKRNLTPYDPDRDGEDDDRKASSSSTLAGSSGEEILKNRPRE